MPKTRILEIVSGLGIGGAERALINRLEFAPTNVDEYVLDLRPQISVLKPPVGIAKIDLDIGLKPFSLQLINQIKEIKPDLIVVRTPIDFIRIGFLSLARLIDAQVVFEIHSEFVTEVHVLKVPVGILIRMLRGQPDLVLSVSKHTQKGSLGRIFKDSEVLYLGSKVLVCDDKSASAPGVRYLVSGRAVNVKRPMWILERLNAVSQTLKDSGAKVTFLGGGPLLSEMKNFVDKHDLSSIIEILGPVENVYEYLMESDFLISGSQSEGLPLVFYEAKLAGLRIITTPSGGGEEILGENDILMPDFSEVTFEAAIRSTCIHKTPPLLKEEIKRESQWMSSEVRTTQYYDRILRLRSNE